MKVPISKALWMEAPASWAPGSALRSFPKDGWMDGWEPHTSWQWCHFPKRFVFLTERASAAPYSRGRQREESWRQDSTPAGQTRRSSDHALRWGCRGRGALREPIIMGDGFPTAASAAGLLKLSCAPASYGESFLNTIAWTNPWRPQFNGPEDDLGC